MRGPVPTDYHPAALEKCLVAQISTHVTVMASAHMVIKALRAADFASSRTGLETEVIDLRCLNPLDFETIAQSVRKTKHLLMANNDAMHCGFAKEIVARVCKARLELAAPPV